MSKDMMSIVLCEQAVGSELLLRARSAGFRAQDLGRQAREYQGCTGGLYDQARPMYQHIDCFTSAGF